MIKQLKMINKTKKVNNLKKVVSADNEEENIKTKTKKKKVMMNF